MKTKISLMVGFVLLGVIGTFLLASPNVSADSFNASDVIDDGVFDNFNSMSAAQIDTFLNTFPSSCLSTNNGFTSPDPTGYSYAQGFTFGANVSAGTVIAHAAQAYQINPQVLLATLQKEQSLVTGAKGCYPSTPDPNVTTSCDLYGDGNIYNCTDACPFSLGGGCIPIAVGYGCPSQCNAAQEGFTNQIIRAAWFLKFGEQRSEGNVGWSIVKDTTVDSSGNPWVSHWDNSDDPQSCYDGPMTQGTWSRGPSQCGATTYYDGYKTIDGTPTHIDTGATAALYWYTPHFAGNQSFFTIFTGWFGSPYFSLNITYPVGDDAVDSSGDIAVIPVKLSSPPLSTVQLNYGVSDTSVAKIFGNNALIFTTSNWNTPQNIVVQGLSSTVSSTDFNLQVLYINSPNGAYSQSITPFLNTLPVFWSNLSERAIYRLLNSSTGKHAYAVSSSVVSTLESNGYTIESTLGYQCTGSTNTPLVVDNNLGIVRNIDSPDILNKQTTAPTILFSNANGSVFTTILKDSASTDSVLTTNPSEVLFLKQNGFTVVTSFLLCDQNDTPVYRLYDPVSRSHFYTTSSAESAAVQQNGYLFEGVSFYKASNDTDPVYRLYDPVSRSHFYTTSLAESAAVQQNGYKLEGVAFYR